MDPRASKGVFWGENCSFIEGKFWDHSNYAFSKFYPFMWGCLKIYLFYYFYLLILHILERKNYIENFKRPKNAHVEFSANNYYERESTTPLIAS